MPPKPFALAAFCLGLLAALPARAHEEAAEMPAAHTPTDGIAEPATEEHGHSEGRGHAFHHHDNHAAIFLGTTAHDGHKSPTFGIDYERRLPFAHQLIGIGALIDVTKGEQTSVIAAPALFVHPFGGLKIIFAAGIEKSGEEKAMVVRAAAAWIFHLGRMALGPNVAMDRVHGETAWVGGLEVGVGW